MILDASPCQVETRTESLPRFDRLAKLLLFLEWTARIPEACDTGHQIELRYDGHDLRLPIREVGNELARVPGSYVKEMTVRLPESGHDRHAIGVDDPRARRNGYRSDPTDCVDSTALHQDDGVVERWTSVPVDEPPPG